MSQKDLDRAIYEQFILLHDVDGVIADTPHEKAWKAASVSWDIIPVIFNFSPFYAAYVAGEPGLKGSETILDQLRLPGGMSYFERENINDPAQRKEIAAQFRDPIKKTYLEQYISDGNFSVHDDVGRIIFGALRDGITVASVSASENAANVLKKIDAYNLASRLQIARPDEYSSKTLYDLFDSNTHGAISHWHKADITKLDHYNYARGMAMQAAISKGNVSGDILPYVFVLEDAPTGIKAISGNDFYPIGIARKANGKPLATKQQLLNAGAVLAFDEHDLEEIGYKGLVPLIQNVISHI